MKFEMLKFACGSLQHRLQRPPASCTCEGQYWGGNGETPGVPADRETDRETRRLASWSLRTPRGRLGPFPLLGTTRSRSLPAPRPQDRDRIERLHLLLVEKKGGLQPYDVQQTARRSYGTVKYCGVPYRTTIMLPVESVHSVDSVDRGR